MKLKDTKNWKSLPSLQIGRINIVKIAILPKVTYRLMQFPSKYLIHSQDNNNKP